MIQFFRGPKKGYSLKEHGQGIYFATDTKEILMNGGVFTGPVKEDSEIAWTDVVGSVEEAFTTGGMATLTEDKELSERLIVKSGVSSVLDLSNYSISNKSTSTKKNFAIEVEHGASLTIKGDGTINGGSGFDNVSVAVYGDCKIESGNFTVGPDAVGSGNSCIYVVGGTLEISGGTFSSDAMYNGKYFVLNKRDGSDSVISVTGGTFINYDPSNSETEDPAQNFVAAGYESVRIEGTNNYQVVKIK